MQNIERRFDSYPTIFDGKIEEGCRIENTLGGIGAIIVDKSFLKEMSIIAESLKDEKNLVLLMTKIYTNVAEYYSSNVTNNFNREQTYANNEVTDEDGMIIGTYISSLKGKNISKCSEKSLAAYVILKELSEINKGRVPSLILSNMQIDNNEAEPHAFVMINKDNCNDLTKHILFDVENPTLVEDKDGNKQYLVGLYSLTDEEYHDFISGKSISPTSIYDLISTYREVSPKRYFGNFDRNRSF